MMFRKLIERKNSHVTWLLAFVLFLSGFTFSLSTEYAKEEHVKAKTELVLNSRIKSKKTFSYEQSVFPSALTVPQPSFSAHFIYFQNHLDKIRFNAVTKTRLDFIPLLISFYLPSKTTEGDRAYLLG